MLSLCFLLWYWFKKRQESHAVADHADPATVADLRDRLIKMTEQNLDLIFRCNDAEKNRRAEVFTLRRQLAAALRDFDSACDQIDALNHKIAMMEALEDSRRAQPV